MSDKALASHVSLLIAGTAANRILLSSDGETAIAQLSGRWLAEEYGAMSHTAPPLLKLIDVSNDRVTKIESGWLLSAPGGAGGGVYLTEENEELRYQLRSFAGVAPAWNPPEGLWAVKATSAAAGRLIIALWRPVPRLPGAAATEALQQVAITAVDATSATPPVTRILTLQTARYGGSVLQAGFAQNPIDGTVYIADLAPAGGKTLTIHALDGRSLDSKWQANVPRPLAGRAEASGDLQVSLAVSSDGEFLVAGLGAGTAHGIAAEVLQILSTRSGAMQAAVPAPDVAGLWTITDAGPASGSALGVLSFLESRSAESHDVQFRGLATIDAAQGTLRRDFEFLRENLGARYERMRGLVPTALAWHPTQKRWLLSPDNFAWVRAYGITDGVPATDLPAGQDSGRFRPEVSSQLTIPPTWHRPGRPRIDAWVALGH